MGAGSSRQLWGSGCSALFGEEEKKKKNPKARSSVDRENREETEDSGGRADN